MAALTLQVAKLFQTSVENDIAALRQTMQQDMFQAARQQAVHSVTPAKPGSLEEHARRVRRKRLIQRQERSAFRRGGDAAVQALHDAWAQEKLLAEEAKTRPDQLRNEFEAQLAQKQATLEKAKGAVSCAADAMEKEKEEEREKEREERKEKAEAEEKTKESPARAQKYRPPRRTSTSTSTKAEHATRAGEETRSRKPRPKRTQEKSRRSDTGNWRQSSSDANESSNQGRQGNKRNTRTQSTRTQSTRTQSTRMQSTRMQSTRSDSSMRWARATSQKQ